MVRIGSWRRLKTSNPDIWENANDNSSILLYYPRKFDKYDDWVIYFEGEVLRADSEKDARKIVIGLQKRYKKGKNK